MFLILEQFECGVPRGTLYTAIKPSELFNLIAPNLFQMQSFMLVRKSGLDEMNYVITSVSRCGWRDLRQSKTKMRILDVIKK